MSDDVFSVCQHCFEATPGVFSFEGRVYCEDCYPLVAPAIETEQNHANTSNSQTSEGSGAKARGARGLSGMSLRTSNKGNSKGAVFVSLPIPRPKPSFKPFSRTDPAPTRRKRTLFLDYEDVRVLHRGRTLHFSGAKIGGGVHDGLNALWAREQPEAAGKYTWIGAYKREDGDFIVASRISRQGGPGSGIAFRFTKEKLIPFLKSAIYKAPPAEARIWQWIANSWTLED